MTLPLRPTIRLSSPGDMAIAIPMLLGYHPEESLVLSCLTGATVDLTMRFDLTELPSAEELAERTAHADVAFLAVFSDASPDGDLLPYAEVVGRLYDDPRLRLIDAIYVHRRRWWSYLCPDSACCPPEGRPLDESSEVATSLSAAFALSGAGMFADRNELVASLQVDPELDLAASRRRSARARDRVLAMTAGERLAELRALVKTLVGRFEDPRADLSQAEVQRLAGLLHDVAARDELLVQAVPPARREVLLRVLRIAVRRVAPPLDAPLCTALAWFAYADGDGTTTNIALDRALRSAPDYSLASLIAASLDRQLPPGVLIEVMKGAARDLGLRDEAG